MTNKTTAGGIGLLGLIFICFFVLKVLGYIHWSWWFVTAPLWGPTALMALLLMIGFITIAAYDILLNTFRTNDINQSEEEKNDSE